MSASATQGDRNDESKMDDDLTIAIVPIKTLNMNSDEKIKNKCSAVADGRPFGHKDRLATNHNRHGPKIGAVPLCRRGSWVPI